MARWKPFSEIEALFRALDFGRRPGLRRRRASFPGGVARGIPLVHIQEERGRKGLKRIAKIIPANWRQALGRWRRDAAGALGRWLAGLRRENDRDRLMEVQDRRGEVIVLAKGPGFWGAGFSAELIDDRLVRGEKGHRSDGTGPGYYRSERSDGAFVRTIAQYKSGLLCVMLPKA